MSWSDYDDSSYSYEICYSDENTPVSDPVDLYSLLDDAPSQSTNSPPPQVATDDSNIAFSTSINQSREFIYQNLHIPVRDLRSSNVPGLVILRLQDFSTIRNVSALNRTIPHIIIGPPSDEFLQNHPDFQRAFHALHS